MRIKKQSFLGLDIGTNSVRGFALVADDSGVKTYVHSESGGTLFGNIANLIDVIETKMSVKFKGAFVTGNFGNTRSIIGQNVISFGRPHRIIESDIYNAICNSPDLREARGQTLHLIPLQFLIDGNYEAKQTNNISCNSLAVRFNCITCPNEIIDEIKRCLGAACVPPLGFFDPIYLLTDRYHRPQTTTVCIDFGKTSTRVGIRKDRGLTVRFDLEIGQNDVTEKISADFGIDYADAENLKLSVLAGERPAPSDGYVSANEKFPNINRQNIWDAWADVNNRIADQVLQKIKADKYDLFITGGGLNPDNINSLILRNKGLDNVTVLNENAIVGAFGKMFQQNIRPVKRRRIKIKMKKNVPVLPSVICWNINNDYVYRMFESVGVQALHCDIMDGFYTDRVSGTLDDIKTIRAHTRLFLQAHLMVEDPLLWCGKVAELGIDAIVISSGTRHIVETLRKIKSLEKLCGLALHPDFNLKNLSREILTMLDQIVVMSVLPGESGQQFMPDALGRIRTLANTRKIHGFKYKIIADGGINDKTAPDCWAAGADFLISGSYLRSAPDFADAIIKLLPR